MGDDDSGKRPMPDTYSAVGCQHLRIDILTETQHRTLHRHWGRRFFSKRPGPKQAICFHRSSQRQTLHCQKSVSENLFGIDIFLYYKATVDLKEL